MALDEILGFVNSDTSKTLDKKIDEVKVQRKASITGVGTTVFSWNTSIGVKDYDCLAKFVAPIDGVYKITLNSKISSNSASIDIYKVVDYIDGNCVKISQDLSYDASTIDSYSVVNPYGNKTYWDTQITINSVTYYYYQLLQLIGEHTPSRSAATSSIIYITCRAGERIQLVGYSGYNNIDYITITCQGAND